MPLATDTRRVFLTAIEKRYGRSLRRFLAGRLHHAAADVPDLVQEVYLRMLRIDDHEAIQNPQAYLYTVASHVVHRHLLRQSVSAKMTNVTEAELDVEHDPAEELALEQQFQVLGAALQKLSPNAYATLVMHRRDGVPLKEVAERLGVSYGMAKRYLGTALTYLQKRLRETEQGK